MSFLQIGSWNIEHLGGSSRAERRQSAFALADHIEMAGIDLLALQEIYVTDSDEEVRLLPGRPVVESRKTSDLRNADLDVVCFLLEEHLDTPWKYRIFPNRGAGDKSQLCAVLWNEARVKLERVQAINVAHTSAAGPLWDRKPHVATFVSDIVVWRKDATGEWHEVSEKRRFSLVPLHMKSNYGGVTKNRQVRALEATSLCEALGAMAATIDPSLILVGDTNILRNDEPAIETFLNNGFIDLNNNDSTTYWSKDFGESPFDRAFIASARPEFRYTRQYVLRSSDLAKHDRFLSDHYMIKISIKDYVDDADPRPDL